MKESNRNEKKEINVAKCAQLRIFDTHRIAVTKL